MTVTAATRDAYGAALEEIGGRYPEVVVLDADLSESTRTYKFAKKYPDRFFQMGISEQDMVCTAAGLASAGKMPFASSFAIFGSRAWEQIRNMVCRANLNVNLCFSHAGISVGEDGASAQALEDIAITRALPRMRVFVPADDIETTQVINYLVAHRDGPAYVRLGRAKVPRVHDEKYQFRAGRADKLREGKDATIIACGIMVAAALDAADLLEKEGVKAVVLNMSTIKPIDAEAIAAASRATGRIVTAEEHSIIGGLGSAVAEVLAERAPCPMKRIGTQDVFGESGAPDELLRKYGLTKENIAQAVRSLM
jgi:transketolase